MKTVTRTVTWTGRIAWVGWRSADGRMLKGSMVTRVPAPVLWRPPIAEGPDPYKVVGQVAELTWAEEWVYGKPVEQLAVLYLDINALSEVEDTLYPEIDLAGPWPDDRCFVDPVLAAITLGTRPIWTGLDPVLHVSNEEWPA